MGIDLDHLFIGCRPGAPEADVLLRHGFVEGTSNTHVGQGTANRRFFFENFKLELIWVVNQSEVTSAKSRPTRLWERCANPEHSGNPFGILFRSDGEPATAPFQTWRYCPDYLPEGTAIEVAVGTSLDEPELFYLPFVRSYKPNIEPKKHRLPFRILRSVAIGVQDVASLSASARSIQRLQKVRYFQSDQPLLHLYFAGDKFMQLDLRPSLPLILSIGQ